MYRIGFGINTKFPYLITPDDYSTQLNNSKGTVQLFDQNVNKYTDVRPFQLQDLLLVNMKILDSSADIRKHLRKAVLQCL